MSLSISPGVLTILSARALKNCFKHQARKYSDSWIEEITGKSSTTKPARLLSENHVAFMYRTISKLFHLPTYNKFFKWISFTIAISLVSNSIRQALKKKSPLPPTTSKTILPPRKNFSYPSNLTKQPVFMINDSDKMVLLTISLFNYGIYSDVFIRIFRSRRMVLFIIFYTLLLDNFLLTALVPIIPDYLIEKDKEQLKQTLRGYHLKVFDNRTSLQIVVNRTQYINFTGNFSNSPNVGGRFSIVQDIFSIPLNKINENTRVGWLLSSKAIVQLMFNFLVGPFTNRCGYVIPVFVGCLIIMASACLFIFGETYIPLFIARSLHGLGSACVTIAGMGMIADKYSEDKERSKAMGIAMGGSAAGVLAGYPLGGCMYIYIGKFAPFLLILVLTAIDSVLLVLFLRSNTAEQLSESGKSIWKLVQDPYILLVSGAIMLTTIALSSLEPTVPIWIMQTMNAEKWQIVYKYHLKMYWFLIFLSY
uniref:Major facilitator superfamily (MFS) profile domain-containing protein n=1 Tax=Octopus bimaculoides TaxID=37653 RepID=A0A0L8FVE3_OCTBM